MKKEKSLCLSCRYYKPPAVLSKTKITDSSGIEISMVPVWFCGALNRFTSFNFAEDKPDVVECSSYKEKRL